MKRKIMAVLTAVVVAFSGAVMVGAPAQAAVGPQGCKFTNMGSSTYTKTLTGRCLYSQARFEYITPNGTVGSGDGPVDTIVSQSPTYSSSMHRGNRGRAQLGPTWSAWIKSVD